MWKKKIIKDEKIQKKRIILYLALRWGDSDSTTTNLTTACCTELEERERAWEPPPNVGIFSLFCFFPNEYFIIIIYIKYVPTRPFCWMIISLEHTLKRCAITVKSLQRFTFSHFLMLQPHSKMDSNNFFFPENLYTCILWWCSFGSNWSLGSPLSHSLAAFALFRL